MSGIHGIFGPTPMPDLTGAPAPVRVAAKMYQMGAILERAAMLRDARDAGAALTTAQARYVALADRLLEVGLDAFIAEGKGDKRL